MKRIQRGEVLGLAEYEPVRERFRARVIAEKKRRRVLVGDRVSVLFENRDSVLLQIQEMVRTERLSREGAIEHEIATYNDLVPGDDELSCTLMVEIPEKAERDAFLVAAAGLEEHVWFSAGGEKVRARATNREGAQAGRTTAVHYLKFALPAQQAATLRAAADGETTLTQVTLSIDHPAYEARAVLPVDTILALAEDLADRG
jgi:hypothetical protein